MLKVKKREASPPPELQDRQDLRFWHRELAAAVSEEGDCASSLARLRAAVEEGAAAETSSVAKILASRGKDFQDAEEAAHKIARGKLAAAAIPRATEELTAAQAEVARLRDEVTAAAKRELVRKAGAVAGEYERRLSEVYATYNKLVGIRGALLGDGAMRAIEAPTFPWSPHAEVGMMHHGCVNTSGIPRQSTLAATARLDAGDSRAGREPRRGFVRPVNFAAGAFPLGWRAGRVIERQPAVPPRTLTLYRSWLPTRA